MVYLSELYGKKIISTTGHWVGEVQHVILDVEKGAVSHLLIEKIKSNQNEEMLKKIFKSSVPYERVKKVSDTVLVSEK